MHCFILNNETHSNIHCQPNLSLLQYLRDIKRLIGTKEGCAAGDCGACTVVIAELKNNQLVYKAINACITPIASLHGKQILTVEYLIKNGLLHPVQQCMVEHHGSQCGFCTPGIIMSLFAWWLSVKSQSLKPSRHSIELALSGNLCRCTGYQPIITAAEQSLSYDIAEEFLSDQKLIKAELEKITTDSSSSELSVENQFYIPQSIKELTALYHKHPTAQLIAGATDIGLEFTQELKQPEILIFTGQVKEMKSISSNTQTLIIGGAVTYSEMYQEIQHYFPEFAKLLLRLGSLQIRNQGTLAGNIANASPIGDTPPILLALNCNILVSSKSSDRQINIDDFFTGYRQTAIKQDEVITAIEMPKLNDDEVLKVYKISKRFEDDISAVCLAIWLKTEITDQGTLKINDIRIGCGGMAATPLRAKNTEAVLRGNFFDNQMLSAAKKALMDDFNPIDDIRASADYRIAVAGKLLEKAKLELENHCSIQLFDCVHEDQRDAVN